MLFEEALLGASLHPHSILGNWSVWCCLWPLVEFGLCAYHWGNRPQRMPWCWLVCIRSSIRLLSGADSRNEGRNIYGAWVSSEEVLSTCLSSVIVLAKNFACWSRARVRVSVGVIVSYHFEHFHFSFPPLWVLLVWSKVEKISPVTAIACCLWKLPFLLAR